MKLIAFHSSGEDLPLIPDYGTDAILDQLVKGSPRVDAIDARFRKIGGALLAASRAGLLKKWRSENLVDSFVRTYRDWKAAQKELPFTDSDYTTWEGRAHGWEMVLGKRGVNVNAAKPMAGVKPPPPAGKKVAIKGADDVGLLDIRDENPTRPPLAGRIILGGIVATLAYSALRKG